MSKQRKAQKRPKRHHSHAQTKIIHSDDPAVVQAWIDRLSPEAAADVRRAQDALFAAVGTPFHGQASLAFRAALRRHGIDLFV